MSSVTMSIHKIEAKSHVDGPGERTVLFTQGCAIHCPGCQNRHMWEIEDGRVEPVDEIAKTLKALAGPGGSVTISGGEPFAQAGALAELVRQLKTVYGITHIIVYSGFTWEFLTHPEQPVDFHISVMAALSYIDVLVDGPFIKALDDPFIAYRGSRNQRPIDVKASFENWCGMTLEPVILDWGFTEIAIATDGGVFMPVGLAPAFAELGGTNKTRRCGQTKGALK